MTADMPLVTLAIPCFQQEAFVAETLESAFAQTYSPLEIIVADDASGAADLVVGSRGVNVALRGIGLASSGDPNLALDNDLNTVFATNPNEENAFWEVDFGEDVELDRIVAWSGVSSSTPGGM